MDWCTRNDFDIIDDNHDLADFTNEELSRYFLEGQLSTVMDKDDDEEINEAGQYNSVTETELLEHNPEDEVLLSQKLSQLSTKSEDIDVDNDNKVDAEDENPVVVVDMKRLLSPTTMTSSTHSKRMKLTTDEASQQPVIDLEKEKDPVPFYLSLTNEAFNCLVRKLLGTVNSISIQDLQCIALCIYRLGALHVKKQVTNTYLKSGTGTLRDSEPEIVAVDRRVWPAQVKAEMTARRPTNTTVRNMNIEDQHRAYEHLVQERFQEITQQMNQYQQQLTEKKNQLVDFTLTMENMIRNYVHQYGIYPLKLQRDLKITLLKYDYDAEIMERQFLQEKPTEYHIQTAKRLYEARNELEKSKRDLMELKQRVFYNKPPLSYHSTQTSHERSLPTSDVHQQPPPQQQLLIRGKLFDQMTRHVTKMEAKLHTCQKVFVDELSAMWNNHRQLVKGKGMPTALSNLIERRLTSIVDRWRDIYIFRLLYHVDAPYGDWDALQKTASSTTSPIHQQQSMKHIGFHPRTIVDTTDHCLTEQQLQLLNRGPTYVPPCQIHVSSASSSSSSLVDEILKKQYAPLKHQLASLFSKYSVNVALQFTIQNQVYDLFQKIFSTSIPTDIQQRAQSELALMHSIRQLLKNNNLILRRTADNMNTFYLGNRSEFERRADNYITSTNQYQVFCTIYHEDKQQAFRSEMSNLFDSINQSLRILRRRNDIDENLYKRLQTDPNHMKLSYLYFLPSVSQENNITLEPRITSPHNVIYKMSKYLDQLLRPFAHEQMTSVLFKDDIEFMQKLNVYVHTNHRLTSTTLFCTIDIVNYWALDTHENMIEVVCKFIQNNVAANKLQKISIATIKNLLQLCLYHNVFCYKNHIYKFTRGGPTTLPLIDTLSNIYLSTWQDKIIGELRHNKELFGRYKDRVFFTWNGFKNELEQVLQIFQQQYPQIHTRILIDTCVPFFNVAIGNHSGQLFTRPCRNPTVQAYTLPYVVGHSKVNHSDWIRTALLRAVCYSWSVQDFQQQRIHLELTYLASGYSLQFVDSRVAHFFEYFQAGDLRYSMDQIMYEKFRQQCFNFKDVHRALSDQLQHLDDTGQVLHLHYLYEHGARCQFNKEFQQLWNSFFDGHSPLNTKKMTVRLTTKHLHSLNALLAQQKSSCWTSL